MYVNAKDFMYLSELEKPGVTELVFVVRYGQDWYCSSVTNPVTVSQVIWCQVVSLLSLSSLEWNRQKLEVDQKKEKGAKRNNLNQW